MENLVPLVAVAGPFLIAVVAIMAGHQRKMAEMFQKQREQTPLRDPDVLALRGEVAQLKDLVNQMIIQRDDANAIPSYRLEQNSTPPTPPQMPDQVRIER